MPARARGVAPAPRGRLVGAPRPSPPYPARAVYILLLLRCCVPVRRSPSGPGLPAQRHRSTPLTRTSSGTNSPRGGTRSSTLRELYGIVAFIAAVAPLLCGRRNRVLLDNLGCVFILGSVVPEATIGGLAWGEYVTGGSPDPNSSRPSWWEGAPFRRSGSRAKSTFVAGQALRAAHYRPLRQRRDVPTSRTDLYGPVLPPVLPPSRGVDRCLLGPLAQRGQLAVPAGPRHCPDDRPPPLFAGG